MFKLIATELKTSLIALVLFTILCGGVYPLVMTLLAQGVFPSQANGSLIAGKDGKTVGSELIGQPFTDPKYFWDRISATSPKPYDAANSSGSNLGPTNPALLDEVNGQIKALHDADPDNKAPIPVDLVTSSASGLDPHISPAAAEYQVHRVALARKLNEDAVRKLVAQYTEDRQFGFLGDPRVNVLKLNLALDAGSAQ